MRVQIYIVAFTYDILIYILWNLDILRFCSSPNNFLLQIGGSSAAIHQAASRSSSSSKSSESLSSSSLFSSNSMQGMEQRHGLIESAAMGVANDNVGGDSFAGSYLKYLRLIVSIYYFKWFQMIFRFMCIYKHSRSSRCQFKWW